MIEAPVGLTDTFHGEPGRGLACLLRGDHQEADDNHAVCQKEVNGRIRGRRRPVIRGQQRHPASANAGEICYFECDGVQGEQCEDGEPQSQIAKL